MSRPKKPAPVGRIMWANLKQTHSGQQWFTVSSKFDNKIFADFTRKVLVIDLSDQEAVVEVMAKDFFEHEEKGAPKSMRETWSTLSAEDIEHFRSFARSALAALHGRADKGGK